MPTLLACKACGKKLKVPDGATISKARCPGCGVVIAVAKTGITAKPEPPPPRAEKKPKPAPPPEAITDEPPPDEPPAEDTPKPRKKKRRKKREKKPATEFPLWLWGALGGTALVFTCIISAAFIHAGYGWYLLGFAIGMAILLPVSVVILVMSMFIASALLGGVDFGQAHVAIPKAAALLLVVNLLSMIPLAGPLLALPVWWLGLMGLFGLDFVETRTLVIINWGLNSLFKYFVLAAIISGIMHATAGGSGSGPRAPRVPPGEAAAVKKIEALGGTWESDDENGDHITEVALANTAADDSALATLRSFPKLQTLSLVQTKVTDQGLQAVAGLTTLENLDLTGCQQITDAGLAHLGGLPKLQVLLLGQTRISDAGIQRLRAARPGLQVIR